MTDGHPTSPSSIDASSGYSDVSNQSHTRLQANRDFVKPRDQRVCDSIKSSPALVSSTLTKHSHQFSPPFYVDGQPAANMDHVRDCVLVDRLPEEKTRRAFYIWADPSNSPRAGHDQDDGSYALFYEKILAILKSLAGDSEISESTAALKECMDLIVCGVVDEEEKEPWKEATSRVRILLHLPLMKLASTVDLRYDEDLQTETSGTPMYSTESGELVVGTDRYRRDTSSILTRTELRVEYKKSDDTDQHLTFYYMDGEPCLSISTFHTGEEGESETLEAAAPADETRSLLYLAEWSESDLTRVRKKFAPNYVAPFWPALVAACLASPKAELWSSLVIRFMRGTAKHDVPPDQSTPMTWVWNEEQLWHSTESTLRTQLKACATELCELAGGASNKKIFNDILLAAAKRYPHILLSKKPKKGKKSSSGDDDAEEEDDDVDGGGEEGEEDDDVDGGGEEGEEEVEYVEEDDEVDEDAGEDEESDEDGDGANAEDENGGDGEQGTSEADDPLVKSGLIQPIPTPLAKLIVKNQLNVVQIRTSLGVKEFSKRMANNNRFLEALISTITPWISENGFAASFQDTKAVAFVNGVQDFEPPYAFHQPTPLDRVCNRLPYSLPPPPATPEEWDSLEDSVVVQRYMVMFPDKEVALREADKDAVRFLADPATLADAAIRVHLGPFDETTRTWGSRVGKNLRLTLNKSVFHHLVDASKGAGFLSLRMVPGKAYSMFSTPIPIEQLHSYWIDEGQDAKQKEHGTQQQVQPWNPGLVLKLCPGSEANEFQYRVEHGKEKTVKLKLQCMDISTNDVSIPDNPGFKTKLEVSHYPRIGKDTQHEVDAWNGAKRPSDPDAFLIDKSKLKLMKSQPGVVASYFVARAIAIHKDAGNAHPRTESHRKATAQLFSVCAQNDNLDAEEAEERLTVVADSLLTPCKGNSAGSKGSLLDASEDQVDYPREFQKVDATRRCRCTGKPSGTACHFSVKDFATRLKVEHPILASFYIKQGNQTKLLTSALQRILGIDTPGVTSGTIHQFGKYPRGSIFGWTMQSPPQPADSQAPPKPPARNPGDIASSSREVQLELTNAPPPPCVIPGLNDKPRQQTFEEKDGKKRKRQDPELNTSGESSE